MRDNNTKFFHACITQRQKKNKILIVQDAVGYKEEGRKAIEGVFNSYFKELFTSTNPSLETVTKCTEHVPSKVTSMMNEDLSLSYSSEEVQEALKLMSHLKSLSLNGFNAYFSQTY